MPALPLSHACSPYDRTQALRDGTVRPQGIDLTYIGGATAETDRIITSDKKIDLAAVQHVSAGYSQITVSSSVIIIAARRSIRSCTQS